MCAPSRDRQYSWLSSPPKLLSVRWICAWAAGLDKGVQIPSWVSSFIDLEKAATSKTYADELRGTVHRHGLEISELSTHLQGQLVAVHPAYSSALTVSRGYRPWQFLRSDGVGHSTIEMGRKGFGQPWSECPRNFFGRVRVAFHLPWPQRPAGLIDDAFGELGRRWLPILDEFDRNGVDVCYELHPGEDLHDGATFEMFLDQVKNHVRANILYDPSHFVLQQLKYLDFIDIYHQRIKAFHVKRCRIQSNWQARCLRRFSVVGRRAGRFRSIGDGQVDFDRSFRSSRPTITQAGCAGGNAR